MIAGLPVGHTYDPAMRRAKEAIKLTEKLKGVQASSELIEAKASAAKFEEAERAAAERWQQRRECPFFY